MRPTKDNMVVAALLVVMVAAACIFVYMPQSRRIGELGLEIATQRADLEAKSKQAMVVPNFLRHIHAMRERYSDFHSRLPRDKELGGFLKEISELLARENLDDVLFTTGQPSQEGLFNTLPINLELKGSYQNLGRVLMNIKQMKRFTRVQKLEISHEKAAPSASGDNKGADPSARLHIKLQLNIYFTTESGEQQNEYSTKV